MLSFTDDFLQLEPQLVLLLKLLPVARANGPWNINPVSVNNRRQRDINMRTEENFVRRLGESRDSASSRGIQRRLSSFYRGAVETIRVRVVVVTRIIWAQYKFVCKAKEINRHDNAAVDLPSNRLILRVIDRIANILRHREKRRTILSIICIAELNMLGSGVVKRN